MNKPAHLHSLRREAEEALRKKESLSAEKVDDLTPEDMRVILHELRVHQIELELQNEELRQAEVELDASKARYFDLYDLAPVSYCTVSEGGQIVQANLACVALLGMPRSDLLRQRFSIFIPKEDQDIFYLLRKKLLETGDRQSCELRMVKAGGALFWASLSATAAPGADGAPTLRIVFDDITESRHEAEELANFRKAVEQSAHTIVITDTKGAIEYVNPAFEKSTGYTAAEALGGNPRILKSGAQGEAFYKGLWETVTSGRSWQGQFQNKRKDGSLYWESATISPVLDNNGHIDRFIAVKEDITGRKAMETMLHDAVERSEAANRAKSEFLANMSHEIRTPMNGIIGMTDLLLDTSLVAEQRGYAQAIHTCSDSLLALVNDILDFSKIEAGQLLLESLDFDIRSALKDSVGLLAVEAKKKALDVTCTVADDVPEILFGDPGRLRQILLNLLGNAIKFTPDGGITVKVERLAETEGSATLRFSVTDTGVGIPKDKLESVFAKFTQADSSTTREFGGTGLGLAICRQLVRLFQGEIGVESTEGHGSTFFFTAVFGKAPASGIPPSLPGPGEKRKGAAAGPKPAIAAPRRQLRILVAEDNATNRIIALKLLEKLGHAAEAVGDGEEALESLRKFPYDIVLMDCQMPVMDGFDATRAIRDADSGVRNPLIPVIALTAHAMKGDRELCLEAGMNDYLSKPVNPHSLAEAIGRWSPQGSQTDVAPSPRADAEMYCNLCDFDREGFLARTMGDRALAAEMAEAFLADSPALLDHLSDAISARDATAAGRCAHTLKGSSATMGGEILRQIAAEIQAAGKEGDLQRLPRLLSAAQKAYQTLVAKLQEEFPPGKR